MRGRVFTLFAVALLLLTGTAAHAQTAFSDFPVSGQISAFQINGGNSTSDSFTLASGATISQIVFGAWVNKGDSVTSVTWAIGKTPYDTSVGTGTAAATSVYDSTNVDGFDVNTVTVAIPSVNLAAGTYYLTLSNAVSAMGNPNPVSWDINDAVGVDAWNSANGHVSAAGVCFATIGISGSCAESFQLVASGGTPTASLTPLLAFPSTVEHVTSSALAVTLSNTGTGALNNIVPSITGINPDDFAISTGANACGATLAAGASCSIYITFTPSGVFGFSASLSVADSATGSPQTATLLGTGTLPPNSVSLTSLLAFPSTVTHTTSAALAAVLTNTGNNTVTGIATSITGINPDDFAISTGANACGATLAVGASCSIYITFTPSGAFGFSASLSVADSATGSPQTATLLGTGTPPASSASLTPMLAFPSTVTHVTSAALAATLTNNGSASLTGIAPTITGINPDDFAISTGANACGATLAAGASCSIYITFTPSGAFGFSASLSVADSATGSPQTALLLGTGTPPAGSASLTSLLAFPNTVTHVTSSALAATLTNNGSASLTGIAPTITGNNPDDFAISTGANACGATLAAGASCSIYITFTPSGAFGFSASLSVADSATGSPQTALLLGTGTLPPNSVSLTPSTLAFPSTAVHTTTAALAATLTNTGSNTVTGIATSITGINPDDFTISTGANACGATLAVGASCSIYVTFTPSGAFGFSASLSVADSATGSPQTATLLGTGH